MSEKKIGKSGIIQAAGGILWRQDGRGKEFAIVHRRRYHDWTLPKGWRERGETFIQAAVREVSEETNCHFRLGEFAGCSCYTVDGVPKIVLFWQMELKGKAKFKPNNEVDKLIWLSLEDALTRLSYDNERRLLNENGS
jgi:8-oxo-dGTP pyrophosphatase MutT (NUDIX family)